MEHLAVSTDVAARLWGMKAATAVTGELHMTLLLSTNVVVMFGDQVRYFVHGTVASRTCSMFQRASAGYLCAEVVHTFVHPPRQVLPMCAT